MKDLRLCWHVVTISEVLFICIINYCEDICRCFVFLFQWWILSKYSCLFPLLAFMFFWEPLKTPVLSHTLRCQGLNTYQPPVLQEAICMPCCPECHRPLTPRLSCCALSACKHYLWAVAWPSTMTACLAVPPTTSHPSLSTLCSSCTLAKFSFVSIQ